MPMKETPRFSVIIPVFNRPQLVRRAIESVLKQTRPADEIIVVDDGSTDETLKVVHTFVPAVQLISQSNKGVSAARNAGIGRATGNWIALLDSDDEWLPEKLTMAEKYIQNHPECRIFQSEELWIRNGIQIHPKEKHKKYGGDIFKQSLPLCIVSPSAVVIQRDLLDEVGLFDETFPVSEDYELWLRIAARYPIGLDTTAGIIKHGGHADQLSRTENMSFWRIRALEKLLQQSVLSREQEYRLLQELTQKLGIWITGARKRNKNTLPQEERLQRYRERLAMLDSEMGC